MCYFYEGQLKTEKKGYNSSFIGIYKYFDV